MMNWCKFFTYARNSSYRKWILIYIQNTKYQTIHKDMFQDRWPEVTRERYIMVKKSGNVLQFYSIKHMINYKEIPANAIHGCFA